MALHVSCNIQCKVSLVCYLFSKVITPSFRSTYMDHGMPDPVSAPEKHIRKKLTLYLGFLYWRMEILQHQRKGSVNKS